MKPYKYGCSTGETLANMLLIGCAVLVAAAVLAVLMVVLAIVFTGRIGDVFCMRILTRVD